MNEEQIRAEFEAWWKQTFLIEHGKWKYADMEALLFQAWQAALEADRKHRGVTEGWLRAIDEELVMTCLGVASCEDDYDTAKRKLDQLIQWHITVATDSKVNGGFSLQPDDKIAALQAEIEALRRDVEEWKSVASAQTELHDEAEEAAEKLVKSLAELITWIPTGDTYRRLGFDPEAPMRALERAKLLIGRGGLNHEPRREK